MNNTRTQRGSTSLEFAVVGLLLFIVLFGAFEIARTFYVMNALNEATRRGARVAAVCPINDPAIREIAIFNTSGGGADSRVIPGLSTANVDVNYLDSMGSVISDPAAQYSDIWYIRVAIVNYEMDLNIPMMFTTLTAPEFATTLPRESLGVSREGVTPC
jgi:hypothetical protein